jgi:hypothetical protein
MGNARRGDVDAIFDGKRCRLRLTLGALAELEQAFGADDLVSLAARFEGGRLSARDLLRIIAAGLRGGGLTLSDEEVAQLSVEGGIPAYVSIASDLLAAAFGVATQENPIKPQGV